MNRTKTYKPQFKAQAVGSSALLVQTDGPAIHFSPLIDLFPFKLHTELSL